MHIGWNNIETTYKLASVDEILDQAEVDNECDLGANFQSNLQFDKRVANICAKANRIVGIITRTFSHINIDMFRIFLKSFARPIFVSCSSAWSPYAKVSARKI